jgi:hypothetical protein
MRRSIDARLDRLDHAFAKPLPSLYLRYVEVDPATLARFTPDEQIRLVLLADQCNAHVDALVAVHGRGVLRDHAIRNDALDALGLEDLEWLELRCEALLESEVAS